MHICIFLFREVAQFTLVDADDYNVVVNVLSGELFRLKAKHGNSEPQDIPASELANKRILDPPIIWTKGSGRTRNFCKATSKREHQCTRWCGGSGHNKQSCTFATSNYGQDTQVDLPQPNVEMVNLNSVMLHRLNKVCFHFRLPILKFLLWIVVTYSRLWWLNLFSVTYDD